MVKVDDSINKEIFIKNVSIFNAAIEAFTNDDKVGFMKTFADSLKWSGPDKKQVMILIRKKILPLQ